MSIRLLAGVIALYGVGSVAANMILSENFDSGMPGGWSVIDNEGNGMVWGHLPIAANPTMSVAAAATIMAQPTMIRSWSPASWS